MESATGGNRSNNEIGGTSAQQGYVKGASVPNFARHRIAALLRFGINVKGYV
jgi:hypothetical protein